MRSCLAHDRAEFPVSLIEDVYSLECQTQTSGMTGSLKIRVSLPAEESNSTVTKYYASLAKGLDDLEKKAETHFMSFEFVAAGISLLRTAHSGVLLLIQSLSSLPVSKTGAEYWVNEYMDETVKLLNVCNVLKTGVSELNFYQNLVQCAIRALEDPRNLSYQAPYQAELGVFTLNACEQEMMKIDTENRALIEAKIETGGKLNVNLDANYAMEGGIVKCNQFRCVFFALKTTTSYICRLLLCAIVCIGPIPSLDVELVSMTWKSPLKASLVRLYRNVAEKIAKTKDVKKCPIMLSSEVELLEGALADLRAQLQPFMRGTPLGIYDRERLKQTVRTLKKASQLLQMGVLETVDSRISDLFDDIVEGRNKLPYYDPGIVPKCQYEREEQVKQMLQMRSPCHERGMKVLIGFSV